ncbi:MAG: N-acetylmuramoyl-L-alanine amidase family protein, partial [Defluviitaleaceae bacterium]|nr:N-acetylmuramoyl-L-alanine amidase family protein [Defluviitaleaceae bacterium]
MKVGNFLKRLFLCMVFVFGLFTPFALSETTAFAQDQISMELRMNGQVIQYQNRAINLSINGVILQNLEMPPVILNGRTLVPLRQTFETLGAVVEFHAAQQRIMIARGNDLVVLHIGELQYVFNTTVRTLDVAPIIINDRTMIPVAQIARDLGFNVAWDDALAMVYIFQGDSPTPSPTPGPPQGGAGATPTPTPTTPPTTPGYSSIDESEGAIPLVAAPETRLQTISWSNDRQTFHITASSVITGVNWNMLSDGRLVLDIPNSISALEQSSFDVNSNIVSSVRTGQNAVDGTNVMRIVFDLNMSVIYRISISEDRRIITVQFERNPILDIVHVSEGNRDIVVIMGGVTPQVDIHPLYLPNRLVIDLPNSEMLFDGDVGQDSRNINGVRFSQFNERTARVVLDLNGYRSYNVIQAGNSVIITLFDPTHANISYNAYNGNIEIMLPALEEGGNAFEIHQIEEIDSYLNRRYSLILPGDFSEFFGYGEMIIRHGHLDYLEVGTANGQTRIDIHTYRIMAYFITEESREIILEPKTQTETQSESEIEQDEIEEVEEVEEIEAIEAIEEFEETEESYEELPLIEEEAFEEEIFIETQPENFIALNPVHPKEKYPRIVYIDPGHGGQQPGATHFGVREADLNLRISEMVIEILLRDGYVRPYASRHTDVSVNNTTRANRANDLADIFVSIHHNAANGRATGTEVLYFITEGEPQNFNSQTMAQIFQDNLVSALGTVNRGLRNRPLLLVLNSTQIPSVLIEVGFMDNRA